MVSLNFGPTVRVVCHLIELIFQSEGVSAATEKLIDEVGTTLLLRMVVDQEPKKVKTSSLDMVLNRLSPRSLKTNREYVQYDVGSFKVPFEAITGKKAKDTQFVDFLVSCLFLLFCCIGRQVIQIQSYTIISS